MTAITKSFTAIADSAVDPDSPIDTALVTALRDNTTHLREWLGASYYAGAVQDHKHDGTDSALVANRGAPIASGSVSGVASFNLTSLVTSAYKFYEIELYNLSVATNNANVAARVSVDNGANWKSGAADYKMGGNYGKVSGTAGVWNGYSATYISLTAQTTNNSSYTWNARLLFIDPYNSNSFRLFRTESYGYDNVSGDYIDLEAAGHFWNNSSPGAINAMQILGVGTNFSCDYIVRAWN